MKSIILSFCLIFLLGTVAAAYDKTGHRIIARIAYLSLNKKAKAAVDKLLGKDGLVNYANWADEIKSDRSYDFLSKWHYWNIDNAYGPEKTDSLFAAALAEKNNILWSIDSLSNRLRTTRTDTVALKLLTHFAGDLFQPLHFGKLSDRGGNNIKLKWFSDSTNLHAIWDSYMVEMEQLSYTEYVQYLSTCPDFHIYTFSLKEAFARSYQISRRVYAFDYSRLYPYNYHYAFSRELKESLLNGGVFLARMLNRIYS